MSEGSDQGQPVLNVDSDGVASSSHEGRATRIAAWVGLVTAVAGIVLGLFQWQGQQKTIEQQERSLDQQERAIEEQEKALKETQRQFNATAGELVVRKAVTGLVDPAGLWGDDWVTGTLSWDQVNNNDVTTVIDLANTGQSERGVAGVSMLYGDGQKFDLSVLCPVPDTNKTDWCQFPVKVAPQGMASLYVPIETDDARMKCNSFAEQGVRLEVIPLDPATPPLQVSAQVALPDASYCPGKPVTVTPGQPGG